MAHRRLHELVFLVGVHADGHVLRQAIDRHQFSADKALDALLFFGWRFSWHLDLVADLDVGLTQAVLGTQAVLRLEVSTVGVYSDRSTFFRWSVAIRFLRRIGIAEFIVLVLRPLRRQFSDWILGRMGGRQTEHMVIFN